MDRGAAAQWGCWTAGPAAWCRRCCLPRSRAPAQAALPAAAPLHGSAPPPKALVGFEAALGAARCWRCWRCSPAHLLASCLLLSWPQALIDFENVLGMEPANYLGDNFSRVTQVYRITQYNIGALRYRQMPPRCRRSGQGAVTQGFSLPGERVCSPMQRRHAGTGAAPCGAPGLARAAAHATEQAQAAPPSPPVPAACCYSMLDSVDDGLDALNSAMASGAALDAHAPRCTPMLHGGRLHGRAVSRHAAALLPLLLRQPASAPAAPYCAPRPGRGRGARARAPQPTRRF